MFSVALVIIQIKKDCIENLTFARKPGHLEHFIQIVFRVFVSGVLRIEKIKKDHTVMWNVLDVSFAENGKNVFS